MPNKKYKIPETGFVPVFEDFFMYAICSSVLFLIEILRGAWGFVLLPAFPDSHECCGCLPF